MTLTLDIDFVHDLRNELLEPDTVRSTPLDMSQYRRLFGTSRVPTQVSLIEVPSFRPLIDRLWNSKNGCRVDITEDSKHIVVLRRGQMCKSFFSIVQDMRLIFITW